MTRRQFIEHDLQLFYSGNRASYCDTSLLVLAPCAVGQLALTPALAAPPTITGVETSYGRRRPDLQGARRSARPRRRDPGSVWVTWTDPAGRR